MYRASQGERLFFGPINSEQHTVSQSDAISLYQHVAFNIFSVPHCFQQMCLGLATVPYAYIHCPEFGV